MVPVLRPLELSSPWAEDDDETAACTVEVVIMLELVALANNLPEMVEVGGERVGKVELNAGARAVRGASGKRHVVGGFDSKSLM